jgi:F-type H+-transporting ATPase subunit delta
VIEHRIVRRYASALFAAASRAGPVDQVESDLGLVNYAIEQSPDLWEALVSPIIPPPKKREILADIFEGKVSEITLSYLGLCVDKRREEVIRETEAEFVTLANEARGIILAEATSATELSDDQEARLISKLSETTGKRVELSRKVDPSLIGGLLVRMGDTVIDGSIRGQLEALRERLLES